MHLVGILDLHTPRAARRHVIVARTRLAADRAVEEIEDIGRTAIDVGVKLDHRVDIEFVVRRAGRDRRTLRHPALPIDPLDAPAQRAALALDPIGERMITPLRLGIVARRQLDRSQGFRKEEVGFRSNRAKAVKEWTIHGNNSLYLAIALPSQGNYGNDRWFTVHPI